MAETKLSFDEALSQLEGVVKQLEMGELPLEQAIELYKQGMELSGQCHQKLQKIESEVATLVESNGQASDFEMAGQ